MPTHQAGDLIIVFASRMASTIPSLVSGYTSLATGNRNVGTGNWGARIAYKIAATSSETVGTWTNAQAVIVAVYRGVAATGAIAQNAGASNTTITYPALTLQATNSQSWIIRFVHGGGSASSVSDLTTNLPTGYVQRNGSASDALILDSNGPVSVNPTADTQVTSTANYWFSATLEITAADDASKFFALF